MKIVFEVTEWFPFDEFPENRKLWDSIEKAEFDFMSRVEKYRTSLRLINEKDFALHDINNPVVFDGQRSTMHPMKIKQAKIYYYPPQCEVEGEPLWADELTIKIEDIEVN